MLSTLCIWLFVLHAALLSASGAQLKHNQQHVLSINSNNDSSSNIPIQSESEDQGSHRSMYLVDTMNFASLLEVKSTSESLLNATASASSSLSTHTKKLLKHHHKHHKHHHKRHHTQSSLMQMQTQTQTSVNAEVESEAELRASVILDILTTANASLLENLQTNVTVGFLTVVDADSKVRVYIHMVGKELCMVFFEC